MTDTNQTIEKCNHILGQCTSKVLNKKTGDIITTWTDFIFADNCKYDIKTGMINLSGIDEEFNFCPVCGIQLPKFTFNVVNFSGDV